MEGAGGGEMGEVRRARRKRQEELSMYSAASLPSFPLITLRQHPAKILDILAGPMVSEVRARTQATPHQMVNFLISF